MSNERRNFALVLLVAAGLVWSTAAWVFMGESTPLLTVQRVAALVLLLGAGAWLVYGLRFENKLPDHLGQTLGGVYYEAEGLCFMPIVRLFQGRPELCVFYQNRFDSPVEAIVHLRPLDDAFQIKEGWHDLHFAFRASGGDFGVIHQPITVPEHLRGEVMNFHLAAASYYPRGHGLELRRQTGMPCGTMLVDWAGSAFKTGVHEVSGEIELIRPTPLHLCLPDVDTDLVPAQRIWRQERIVAGMEAMA